ncbi:MAG: hypothetical protein JWM78_1393 [Verrucomicrobiaceae bacterium]|nr:hypothetical protein [Verrucomicrobiaceae bacterium]
MTEQTSSNEPALASQLMPPHPKADWLLSMLVSFANELSLELGVTINTGGAIISGTLIGGKTYLVELSEVFAKANGEQAVNDALSQGILRNQNIYETDETPALPPAYIHLRNARFWAPDGESLAATQGFLWRARLSEVSGFSIGGLEPTD